MTGSTFEMMQSSPPEIPGRPFETSASTAVPVPIVYEREPAGLVEYQVLTLSAPSAAELEETLNSAGHDGWWLAQLIPQGTQLLLVFVRQSARR